MTDIANMAGVLTAIRRMSIPALGTALLLATLIGIGNAQIALAPLSKREIEYRLFGQRVIGEYANGQSWAENFNADGSSQYVQDGELTVGKMHFEGKRLCFTYDPREMIGGCFEIWPRGKNCFDFYARNENGLPARLEDKRFGRAWDARAWIDGEPATCQTEHIS
ncbi:MAG: hypothetical protein ACR2PF_10535 [Rhizobiaceae bacterium]